MKIIIENENECTPDRPELDISVSRKNFEGTEEEWRRKLQRDWRNKAKDIRKSQLEVSQNDYEQLSRSKSYLHGPYNPLDNLRPDYDNNRVSQIGPSADRTSMLFHRRKKSDDKQRKSANNNENYWKERVELHIDEKKQWMK